MPDGFTWSDAKSLLRAHRANGQAAMATGVEVVQPAQADLHSFMAVGQFVTPQFFAMFGARFRVGGAWTLAQGKARAPVVVLNSQLKHKLFGGHPALGQTVQLDGTDFRVVGVLHDWYPQPAFYRQPGDDLYGKRDAFFMPMRTALAQRNTSINGHISCWGSSIGSSPLLGDQCTWVQFWVELDTPVKVAAYRRFLGDYWHQQQDQGRTLGKAPPHLFGMMAWLRHEHLVPQGLKMQLWLALGFLLVCMLSVVALLLAKFMRRSGEISVRRAMGAKRHSIFVQLGIEAGLLGVAGGLLGLGIAQLGLWSVRDRAAGYAHLAQMDGSMLGITIAFAVVVTVLAGLLPAWLACLVPPALQLKTL